MKRNPNYHILITPLTITTEMLTAMITNHMTAPLRERDYFIMAPMAGNMTVDHIKQTVTIHEPRVFSISYFGKHTAPFVGAIIESAMEINYTFADAIFAHLVDDIDEFFERLKARIDFPKTIPTAIYGDHDFWRGYRGRLIINSVTEELDEADDADDADEDDDETDDDDNPDAEEEEIARQIAREERRADIRAYYYDRI